MSDTTAFFRTCATGDIATMAMLLAADPSLAQARDDGDRTGLHLAHRHPEAVRLLLARGADPNARERGDNVTPLHLAAANRVLESVRLLLDAGADVHGAGDLHEGDVIGWAAAPGNADVIDLLVSRGARHHVFSALALRDHTLLRRVIADDPSALTRRRSRFEHHQTAVHAAFAAADGLGYLTGTPDLEALAVLIELGADVNAPDGHGRTPLDVALLRGQIDAARQLTAAGATRSAKGQDVGVAGGDAARSSESVMAGEPMFAVGDGRATVRWFEALGFAVLDAYEEDGDLRFARLGFGRCRFAVAPGGGSTRGASLWVFTSAVAAIYAAVRERQLAAAEAALADASVMQWPFDEDLYRPFYGGQQFSVRDPNGIVVVFCQPDAPE
jgi:hypothetical protein